MIFVNILNELMFFLVDAFTEFPFKGNPAGVYIVNEFPSDFELQKIASYYNWSEIAFLKQIEKNTFFIRWISPKDEAPLCGHATLAASHIIFSNKLVDSDTIKFIYNEGSIISNKNIMYDSIEMSFPIKPIKKCETFPFLVKNIIGIKKYVEVLKDDTMYIIVLESEDDIKNAIPDFNEILKIDIRAVSITAKGSDKFDFYSRYFAPSVGIYEDPVCGSMHCRLAYYWKEKLKKDKFLAYQASKREGILGIQVKDGKVIISGKAFTVCKIL